MEILREVEERIFLAEDEDPRISKTPEEALEDGDWKRAMEAEISALNRNKTWLHQPVMIWRELGEF